MSHDDPRRPADAPDAHAPEPEAEDGATVAMAAPSVDEVRAYLDAQSGAQADTHQGALPEISLDGDEAGPSTVAIASPFHPRSVTAAAVDGEGAPRGRNFAVAGFLSYLLNVGPHARRYFSGNLAHNLASADERAFLTHNEGISGASSQSYVTWRRSGLVLMIVPLTITIGMALYNGLSSLLGEGTYHQIEMAMAADLRPWFRVMKIAELVSFFLSLVLAMLALKWWSNYRRSRRLLLFSWAISFTVPFLLALVPLRLFVEVSDDPRLATALAFYPQYEPAFQLGLNLALALYVFAHLAPAVLSLFPASIRASLILKSLIPESPLMGFVAVSVPLGFVFFGLMFFLILHQIVGTWLLVLALVLFICSPLTYVARAKTMTRPMAADEGYGEIRKTRTIAMLFALAAVGVLAFFTATSDLMLRMIDMAGLTNPLIVLQKVIDYMAKFFLTTVVISDLFMRVLQGVRIRELTNPMREALTSARERRLDQLLTMTEQAPR